MIITDFLRQKMVDRLGGWQSATACHYNLAVYRAKCKVIDSIDEAELAKASFKGASAGRVPTSSDNNAVPAQQATLSLDDIV